MASPTERLNARSWEAGKKSGVAQGRTGRQRNGLAPRRQVIYNVDNLAENLGTFEQAVLLSLAHPRTPLGQERYGRAVLNEVQHRLQRTVSAGAVYATLDRLEQKG